MRANAMPWSIKGVSSEARTLAKSAAGAASQSIGPWLSQVIRAASRAESEAAAPASLPVAAAAAPRVPVPAVDWRAEIEALTVRVAKLEARAVQLFDPLDQAVDRIAHRLDAIERHDSELKQLGIHR
jgi:hypothetical protein